MSLPHMMPRVSVVMPVYNDGTYIRSAIESILAQTFRDFELIILNDASTDQTGEVILSIADPRIRYIKGEENKGPAYRRNEGFDLSRGELIAFLDGDDIAPPERLAAQVEAFDRDPELGILGGQAQLFDENGHREQWRFPLDHDAIMARIFFRGAFCNPSLMLRKSVLLEHGIRFDEKLWLAEDYLLWFQVLRVSRGANLPGIMVNYRVSGSQLTRTRVPEKYRSLCDVRGRMIAEMGITGVDLGPHNDYLDKDWENDLAWFQAAHDWFASLIQQNRRTRVFPPAAFEREIVQFLYNKWRVSTLLGKPGGPAIFRAFLNSLKISSPGLCRKLRWISLAKRLLGKA